MLRNMSEAHSETCQTSKMERFAKIVNGKTLHLRYLTGFWERLCMGEGGEAKLQFRWNISWMYMLPTTVSIYKFGES